MRRLTEIAQRSREIARPDKNTVNTVHRRDGVNVVDRLLGFDLHQHRDVVIDGVVVIRQGAVHVAAVRNRDTANAGWRIAR